MYFTRSGVLQLVTKNEINQPRSLGSILGETTIRNTLTPFADYLGTAVVVHERDGSRVGEVLAGNHYCLKLLAAPARVPGEPHPCEVSSRAAALAAMASGRREESVCSGGLKLCASPIIVASEAVGAVVGAVSEMPVDQTRVLRVADDYGIDFHLLWAAVTESFHRPDYLYQAARSHMDRIAEMLGHLYEYTLERQRSIEAITEREQQLDKTNQFLNNLLDGMAEGVFTTDLEGRFTFTNPAVTGITGYAREELCGKLITDILPEDEHAKLAKMMQRRLEGLADHYEIDVIRKDGMRITVGQTVTPLFKGTDVVGKIGVGTDISERRRLQSDLEEQNHRLNLMQSITTRTASGLSSGKAIETLAQEVVETLGYDFCSIFMPAADGKTLEIVAQHGGPEQDFEALNRSGIHDLDNPGFRSAPPAQAFLTGKQVVADPTAREGYSRLREVAKMLGSRAMVATPLEYNGERLGVLNIHTAEAHHFAAPELDFLRVVAAQVASIAGSANVYRQLRESEERYHELYDSAADWMYSLDEEGVIVNCNETMALALGYDRDEMIGRHIDDFASEALNEHERVGIRETVAQGTLSAERHFKTRDGQIIVIALHARVVQIPGQDKTLRLTTGRDITSSKEAERRINLLAAAVDNTHECVIITDLQGDIVSINKAGAAQFGYTPGEMTGMHMGDLWSDENPAGLKEEIFTATMKCGWEGQLRYRRRDGTRFPVFLSSARVDDENGDTIALVGISRDVSEEQRMTVEILKRNRDLAVLNAVAAATAGTQDFDAKLKSSLDAIVNTMNYSSGIIFLMDRDGLLLTPKVCSYEIPEKMRDKVVAIPVGQGHAGQIAKSGSPIFVDDYQNSQYRLSQLPDMPDLVAMGGVPLTSQDRVVGVLLVSTAQPHKFSDEEQALLVAVGKTIGVAIDNARLFEDIARAKSEWETTFDSMANGVSIHDRDFTIVRANRALAEMLGTTTAALIGRKCYEVFHQLAGPIPDCPHQRAVATGKSVTIIAEEPTLGRILNISADPLFDAQGEIIGTVHDVRDITEQEQLRDQLGQSDRLRALGEMAGGVAHDFNNFLTVILGNSQLLLDGDGKDALARESLETIQRAATDAAETVRRIQEFTRVRTTRKFTTVDVNQVINNAIEVARPRWRDEAESRGVKIHMHTELAAVPPANGNASELAEVVLNLLFNAVDALPEGGDISVTSAMSSQGQIEIVVSDNGKGMDEELRRRIFDPFVTTKGPKGNGLGLSLVYGIVSRHGGGIMVESKIGAGATFTVHLPVAMVADLKDTDTMSPKPAVTGQVRHGRVLVIDDEEMIRSLLADILKAMGQQVETAGTGGEGLVKFAQHEAGEFDLVLTDLGMPEMSGWEVVEKIKQLSPDTPVALITGWGDQLDPEKMKASRVDIVIAKPFKVEEVKRLVAEALTEKK